MAIEWKQEPVWRIGYGAKPVSADLLMREIYPNWTSAFELRYDNKVDGLGYSFYQSTPAMSSRSGVTNPRGSNPGAWLGLQGDAAYVYEGPIYTLTFPTAERSYQIYEKVEHVMPYDLWNVSLTSRIVDLDGVVDTSISFNGWSSSVSWDVPNLRMPGQFAVWHTYGGVTYNGFTMWGGSGGSGGTYGGNVYLLDPDEILRDLKARNPDIEWGAYETETISDQAGPASGAGGYGGYGGDITASDSYEMDPVPTASAASLGFINMYNPSAGGLSNLGEEIFPDFEFNSVVDPTGNDLLDAILNGVAAFVDGINQIPKMFEVYINSRLIDYVQDCHIVPVAPTVGAAAHIKLGFRELETTAPKITSEYVIVDLGSVNLSEFYQSFIDYLPFTRAKLYLPFVGFVPLEPEYWQNGTISVKYKFNVYDGSFSAHVIATPDSKKISKMANTVIGQYTGTAIVHVPLTGLNYSSMVSGLIGGAGAMVSAIAGGNVAAAATAALNTAASSPQVMSSNAYTASAAFLGQRKPFIVIERSVSHFPEKYSHDAGLPSKITTSLSAASGFTTVGEVDLSGIGASAEEKAAIRALLASGVYF